MNCTHRTWYGWYGGLILGKKQKVLKRIIYYLLWIFIFTLIFFLFKYLIRFLTYKTIFLIVISFIALLSIFILNILYESNRLRNKYVYRYVLKPFAYILDFIQFILTFVMGVFLPYLAIIVAWSILTMIITVLIKLLNLPFNDVSNEINPAIIYISSLVTMIIMSYKGEVIITLVDKTLNYGVMNRNKYSIKIALFFYKRFNIRRRLYELSIVLYILTVMESFSNITFINFSLWTNYKMVSLETLLTFVAIDTYISNVKMNNKHHEWQVIFLYRIILTE